MQNGSGWNAVTDIEDMQRYRGSMNGTTPPVFVVAFLYPYVAYLSDLDGCIF
jgi:hypothetical protein